MKQHVISAWLLRNFAAPSGHGPVLATYSKRTGRLGTESPANFLARVDSHSPEIEERIARIEDRAARVSRALVAKALTLPPGIARHEDRDQNAEAPLRDGGVVEEMHLIVAERAISALNQRQRVELMQFLSLMFARSARAERITEDVADVFSSATLDALRAAGLRDGSEMQTTEAALKAASHPTERALSMAKRISDFPASLQLWVLRAGPGERFVLGDSPTTVSVALGHANRFMPLFGPSSYVIVLPLHPEVALIVTPGPILPLATTPDQLVDAVNAMTWRWAREHIVAAGESGLIHVRDLPPPDALGWTTDAPIDREELGRGARIRVVEALMAVWIEQVFRRPVRLVCHTAGTRTV